MARPTLDIPGRNSTRGTPTTDSFVNLQMRIGNAQNSAGQPLNQLSGGQYFLNPISRLRIVCDYAYRGSWIVRRAVDCVAEDMTREGVDFQSSLDPKVHEELDALQTELQVWSKIQSTIKWARLYGGCLAFMMIDGEDPSKPLRIDSVRKNSFKGLFVLDRWMVQPSLQDPVTEFGPDLGLPRFYYVNTDANGIPEMTIHYTRVIRLTGDELPYYQKQAENMWDASVLEAIWDRLIAFDSVTMGAAQLVFKAHLRTYKLPNFREMVAEGGPMLNVVLEQMQTIAMFQSIQGMTVIDGADDLSYDAYTFGGLSDLMMQFATQISGALEEPIVRLFGQSPAGFSTGDTDLRNYFDKIKAKQVKQLRPGMTRLYPVMIQSLTGKMPPPEFKYTFKPLWQLNDTDKASVSKQDTEDVLAVVNAGLISDQTALKELKERGRVTQRWTNITDKDIADANDEIVPPPDPSMFGPGGGAEENVEQGKEGKEAAGAQPVQPKQPTAKETPPQPKQEAQAKQPKQAEEK